jgi:hypothetical protein
VTRTQLLTAVTPGAAGLSDDDIRSFCARGFVAIKPTLGPEWHASCLREFDSRGVDGRGFGANTGHFGLRSKADGTPWLSAVFADGAVDAALRSLLGSRYVMHYHNTNHLNRPGAPNQSWHKDPYEHDVAPRHKHALRVCMALYYPQRTTLDNGPTGVLPGRHSHRVISSTDHTQSTEVDQPLTVEAGTVVITHGDTWHRGMVNYSQRDRHMLKFYFVRMEEPHMYMRTAGPSWDHRNPAWLGPVDGHGQDDDAAEMMWNWLRGVATVGPSECLGGAAPPPREVLAEDNVVSTEPERMRAIISCAAHAAANVRVAEELVAMLGSAATAATVDGILLEGWNHSTNEFRGLARVSKACNPSGTNPADLDAMHALAAAGTAVLPTLLQALADRETQPWWVRAACATAIGSVGPGADAAAAALIASLNEDEDLWVRRNSVEALGFALPNDAPAATAEAAAAALVRTLEDRDDVESFDYEQSGSYKETLRQQAALALARLALHPRVAASTRVAHALHEAIVRPTKHKLNTQTQWASTVALERMDTAGSRSLLRSSGYWFNI